MKSYVRVWTCVQGEIKTSFVHSTVFIVRIINRHCLTKYAYARVMRRRIYLNYTPRYDYHTHAKKNRC